MSIRRPTQGKQSQRQRPVSLPMNTVVTAMESQDGALVDNPGGPVAGVTSLSSTSATKHPKEETVVLTNVTNQHGNNHAPAMPGTTKQGGANPGTESAETTETTTGGGEGQPRGNDGSCIPSYASVLKARIKDRHNIQRVPSTRSSLTSSLAASAAAKQSTAVVNTQRTDDDAWNDPPPAPTPLSQKGASSSVHDSDMLSRASSENTVVYASVDGDASTTTSATTCVSSSGTLTPQSAAGTARRGSGNGSVGGGKRFRSPTSLSSKHNTYGTADIEPVFDLLFQDMDRAINDVLFMCKVEASQRYTSEGNICSHTPFFSFPPLSLIPC